MKSTTRPSPKKKFKIVVDTHEINGTTFKEKKYVPLESKVKSFIKKLNKRPKQPSFAIGK